MMGYTLREDEMAIVIRPQDYEEDWNGDVSIELASSKESASTIQRLFSLTIFPSLMKLIQ